MMDDTVKWLLTMSKAIAPGVSESGKLVILVMPRMTSCRVHLKKSINLHIVYNDLCGLTHVLFQVRPWQTMIALLLLKSSATLTPLMT